MKKVIKLTESDLTRIVKRVIEEQVGTETQEKIVQGYGNDPYQYKSTMKQLPGMGQYEPVFYVSKKGSNPKWTKVAGNAADQVRKLYFPNIVDTSSQKRSEFGNVSIVGDESRVDKLKIAADKFPCLEREQVKRKGTKKTNGNFVTFEIGNFKYMVDKDLKGWYIQRYPLKSLATDYSQHKQFRTCDEFLKSLQ